MPYPYSEYTAVENLLLLIFLYAGPLIAYFIVKPLLFRFMDSRNKLTAEEDINNKDQTH
jgi:Sec-independent protein secretion pathway component TatC